MLQLLEMDPSKVPTALHLQLPSYVPGYFTSPVPSYFPDTFRVLQWNAVGLRTISAELLHFVQLILYTLSVSKNLTSIRLPLFVSMDTILCDLMLLLPDPFRGMRAWRKTMEPQKPSNCPRPALEVVERQRVVKERATQRVRSRTVQNDIRGVLERVSACAAGRILNSANPEEIGA